MSGNVSMQQVQYSPFNMRPNTLNVSRDKTDNDTNKFIREALHAWRAKARCSVVPAERLRDLFEELHFSPTEKQINEMLQTAKLFARRGSSLEPNVVSGNSGGKRVNGLTFGEFCVLAADLKRFRTNQQHQQQYGVSPTTTTTDANNASSGSGSSSNAESRGSSLVPKRQNSAEQAPRSFADEPTTAAAAHQFYNGDVLGTSGTSAPEVFLGGSCNPTTWRADVAIPTLDKLGISFYNPQVSDWTPDLIELEHRAKEKARVLFFVMDSETRASAGTIEAAHIAGQNARHLVLVLHPYQPDQSILNEPISAQEFLDLKRNQQLLRELVSRRGLPVLDDIPSGLHRIRKILAGKSEQPTPFNIASRLISVSHAFHSDADPPKNGRKTLAQCQHALEVLGYALNLLSTDNLAHIVRSHRESVATLDGQTAGGRSQQPASSNPMSPDSNLLTFDDFCMLSSYLTVLQQEIHESGCVSPIKGTNVKPPPIYLTNQLDFTHSQQQQQQPPRIGLASLYGSQIFRTSSCKSVPEDQRICGAAELYRQSGDLQHSDSGTSSPQPTAGGSEPAALALAASAATAHYDSDSNDSVFSTSGGSTDSVVQLRTKQPQAQTAATGSRSSSNPSSVLEMRDVYLGGSCALRTKWRDDLAVPLLQQRGVSYHLPLLHESIGSMATEVGVAGAPQLAYLRQASASAAAITAATSGGDCDGAGQRCAMFDPAVLDASRVLLFVITNETRSLAPMTLAAHYIGLGYNVVLCVQMLPEFCIIGSEKLTTAAIKDYNRGRSYLMDLAKRQGVPVFGELRPALDCAVDKVRTYNSRNSI